jgi:hypothetical protein
VPVYAITKGAMREANPRSLDAQKTWIAGLGTPVPATTITGLAPLATVSLRVSVTTKKVSAYCQPVSIIVH